MFHPINKTIENIYHIVFYIVHEGLLFESKHVRKSRGKPDTKSHFLFFRLFLQITNSGVAQ